ncbi:MAG: ThiF family adenylyltransferase [Smithella sp.]|jgi:molybdopterin/thiamine biosynthesis adenylyltransferase
MTPWFLRDPNRLKKERAELDELSRTAVWLVGYDWQLDGDLCLDAVIHAHDYDYELRISFPSLYPDAPSVVRPRNLQNRISTHQYGGADGPLCLEWGPDNWQQDVTAAQMLISAHKLFDIENPLGNNRDILPVTAPSRHFLTIGQKVRSKWVRWYVSKTLQDYFKKQHKLSVGKFNFSLRDTGESWTTLIHETKLLEGEIWRDEQIPKSIPQTKQSYLDVGIWFKTDLDSKVIGQPSNLQEIRKILENMNVSNLLATDGASPIEGFQKSIAGVLIIDRDDNLNLFIILSNDEAILVAPVSSENEITQSRAPRSTELNEKKVGIVGLGSAGSKIAISLARMGIRSFFLADYDLMLPENIQRHALDWQSITQHKVDAMSNALNQISAEIKTDVSRFHITGQESNAVINGTLIKLSDCDLIIDATANAKVFNLLAAIARIANKPLVWLEVFGGGIGGIVARSRPGFDPSPHDMRSLYLKYCEDNPDDTSSVNLTDYALETSEGEIITASDADVAIIAHHAARLVTDCLLYPECSKFPYSMYLIGLLKAWVFDAPFSTIPISTASLSIATPQQRNTDDIDDEIYSFLCELFEKKKNESSSAS